MVKKPKFYVEKSWVNPEWSIVAQLSNGLVVAHIRDETIAQSFTDFLNYLPGKEQPKYKRKPIYPNLKKKKVSE